MRKIFLHHRYQEIAYEDSGSGPPLVLLHGFPFDREMWSPQVRGLSEHFRVLAPDYPGFGRSSVPSESFTIESLAEVVADFLDAIGIKEAVFLAGLSMGGYVALAFARQRPDRLRRLILADTKAAPDDEKAKAGRDRMCRLAQETGATGIIDLLLPKLVSDETQLTRPEVLEQIKRIAARQTVSAIIFALCALRDRPDATQGLARITAPTLILVGEHDAITPHQCSSEMAEKISGSQLVTIPGVGHMSNLEDPARFNEHIRNFARILNH
jgi:pimeloyl-ACP methyl ester carboxylesterase